MTSVPLLLQVPTPPLPPTPPDIAPIIVGRSDVPPDWVGMVVIAFFLMITIIAIGVPLARAFARRMDRRNESPRMPNDVTARLERIEHAVEAMSIEVERVSEGQRFLTKVLTEMRGLPGSEPREVARALPTPAGEETR